jgi:hypothetical protein
MSYGDKRTEAGRQIGIYVGHSQDAMGQQRGAYIHRCIDQPGGAPS